MRGVGESNNNSNYDWRALLVTPRKKLRHKGLCYWLLFRTGEEIDED